MAEEKVLARVQKLLDLANHAGTPADERNAAIAAADKLMVKHAIDEAMLNATLTTAERRTPVNEVFQAADPDSEYWEKFRTVLRRIGVAHNVRMAMHHGGNVTMVGFRDDVEYVKMKWLSVYLHFTKTIDPVWDVSLPVEQNVYNYKVAGYKWKEIHELAVQLQGCETTWWAMKGFYQRWCKKIGEEPRPHTQRNLAYRNSFAEGFVNQICARLEDMMEAKQETVQESGALVLMKDVEAEVNEAFYDKFPHHRPKTEAEMEEIRRRVAQFEADEAKALEEKLAKMTAEERREYEREQARIAREQERDNARYWRNRAKTYDHEGASLGRESANQVNLNRDGETTAANRKEL